MLARIFPMLVLAALAGVSAAPDGAATAHPLVWDALVKTLDAKAGETVAECEFRVTNKSDAPVEIVQLRPSCGCTLADMPATPWILEPGASGSFRATVDFRGKHGKFSKTIHVHAAPGTQMLTVVVNIPEPDDATRLRNQQLALADRQGVFRGDCASCHAAPAAGKTGGELFLAACAICHMAPHRASMVPDLSIAREPRDAAYWQKWIAEGREQTLMPGFAQKHGGPLTDEQIRTLVEFALASLPTQPPAPAK
jgi:mono/diheme cytochrome c family protein